MLTVTTETKSEMRGCSGYPPTAWQLLQSDLKEPGAMVDHLRTCPSRKMLVPIINHPATHGPAAEGWDANRALLVLVSALVALVFVDRFEMTLFGSDKDSCKAILSSLIEISLDNQVKTAN